MLAAAPPVELELVSRGKVRDVYALPGSSDTLLFVATDRVSAFDVVLADGIPDKGAVLTQLSNFWFARLAGVVRNHVVETDSARFPVPVDKDLRGRSVVVRRCRVLPVEAIVRGYLSGSAWKEYRNAGTVCGIKLPAGLRESERLAAPLFTPSTKAAPGEHDENINPAALPALIGAKHAAAIERVALELYARASEYALSRGIIIADTKFEFGVDENDELVLIDEVLTPDSSRFWPADKYKVGESQPSFDKQFIRDYLIESGLDGKPGVSLPQSVRDESARKYAQAYEMLVGRPFSNSQQYREL